MSKQAAITLRDNVNASPALRAKMRAAIEQGQGMEEAIRLGREEGLECSAEDIEQATQEIGEAELSDFELEMVAGGKGGEFPGTGTSTGTSTGTGTGTGTGTPPVLPPQDITSAYLNALKGPRKVYFR